MFCCSSFQKIEQYYLNQAGHGIPLSAFEGVRYQRDHGSYGQLISREVFPLLRYLGKKLFRTGENVYEDFKSGKDLKESLKNRGLNALKDGANEGI